MAGPKQFPKVNNDRVYHEDVIPDVTPIEGDKITYTDYGLAPNRKDTLIRAIDTKLDVTYTYTASQNVVIPHFAAFMQVGASGGGGGGGGGDIGRDEGYPGGGGGSSNILYWNTASEAIPGNTLPVIVGAPGAAVGRGGTGGTGGTSSVGPLTSLGGTGGTRGTDEWYGNVGIGANGGPNGSYSTGGVSTNGGSNGGAGGPDESSSQPGQAGKVIVRFYN